MTKWKGEVASYAPNVAQAITRISSRSLYLSLAAGLALGCATADAADLYWDANATTPGYGGTGSWNLTAQTWSPNDDGVSGPYSAWGSSALDNAIFGGTAGTVTLGSPITANGLVFNVDGYTLSGGTLTLGGATPTITANGSATISSILAGTQGFTKNGGGSLQLSGANTFSGDIGLDAGGIYALTDSALGALSNNITTAAGTTVSLRIDGTATARTVTIGDGGTLAVSGSGVGGARLRGNGNLYVEPSNTAAGIVHLTNDASDYTGTTTFRGCNGVCQYYFSSIGNLGEASSLGAPTTVANGTITFHQSSQYSDRLYYTGNGDSSNRNWNLIGDAAMIYNQGSGALTITGDISTNDTGQFNAESADINLLGVLSGVNYTFVADAGHTVTLGDANTFTGLATIGGTVRAGTLADSGTNSSLGAGTDIALGAGQLVYTGAGSNSNRAWTGDGANGIVNDGSGALALSGDLGFVPGNLAPDSLTLGGSYAGTNTFTGVISGAGDLIGDGAGTWVLGGANSFTGTVTVNNGTLRAGNASAFGAASGFTVNGGTLDLGGIDLTTSTLQGTGGVIALGAKTLTVDTKVDTSFAGGITGSGGLVKSGIGTLTLTGTNTYTSDTVVGGGGLTLDFSAAGAPADNILSASSTLTMAGGKLDLVGADGASNTQSFNGLNITAGSNRIAATAGAGGSSTIDFGAINRSGGLVNFVLPASGSFTTTNTALGGWATVNGSDYAKVLGGVITAFTAADYSNKDDAGNWLTGEIISDAGNAADTPFFGTVASSQQLGGLKYTAAADSTVTIAAGQTLGIDGTIIVASSVGANDQAINGGSLTGGAGGGTLGVLQHGDARFTIGSTIVDNGGATGFTKGGEGIVRLSGVNTYTGVTTLSGGELQIVSLADAGSASSIGAASTDASNLILESGMLHYVGGGDGSTNRGFTLVNGGASAPVIQVDADRTIEFSGLVTSPDDAGLTKTGWGTLILSNTANDYVGVTTITGGSASNPSRLSVNTLADGGVASGIGAASSDSSNLVLSDGGRLQYTGGTVAIDRGFTLASGNGRIGVTQAATTLAVGGTVVGTGQFVKDGDGTLVLSGTNSFTGGTVVTAGTLVAGSVTAFGGEVDGTDAGRLTVNAGATADLADNNIFVGGLSGSGSVLLGAATLNINNSGTFTGTISGTGGISVTRSTQTMTGCNNTYTGVTSLISTVSVDCLADGGQASGIGAASSDPANLLINGTLSYTGGSVTVDRGFTTTGGQIVVTDAGATLELTGATTGGGFIKDGAGTLVLSGATTRNGTTQIDDGTLRAGTMNAFGSGRINFANAAGATVDLAGFDTTVAYLTGGGPLGGNITLGTATLTLNNGSGSATYAGGISGSGGLILNGGITQKLTGCDSSYTGTTVINDGVLAASCVTDGGANSSIGASTANASNLVINGGTLRYIGTGGSTDRQFTLGASGGNALDASGTGAITFASNAPLTFSGTDTAQTLTLTGTNEDDNVLAAEITNNGTGETALTKTGTGTWIITNPDSSYTGKTVISGGVLGVDKLANGGLASSLGASSADASNLAIGNGSTLRYTGTGDTTNRLFTLAAGTTFIESSGTGAIVFTDLGPVTLADNNQDRTIALGGTNTGNNTLAGSIGDAGSGVTILAKNDGGTWVLTGNNTYTGNTVINGGTLVLGNGGTTGSIVSDTINLGTLAFNRSDTYTYGGVISNVGAVVQQGTGTMILAADNSYTGATDVVGGTLIINGDQSAATGLVSVATGATLGGSGVIGGDVTVVSGTLAPGNSPGTLTINGNLSLDAGSTLSIQFGQANTVGGALNDLIKVGGDLVLDGTLNVSESAGGNYGPGVYRVINYTGGLTDNGLEVGALPSGSGAIQTSVAGQVNLLAGDGDFSFWDGDAGPKDNGAIDGGNGTWQNSAGNDNWTESTGYVNAAYADGTFAVFEGSAGTVTVDNGLGAVSASGMQFASDNYLVTGGDLALDGPQSTIRVGDGTAAGAGYTATIASNLAGASQLVKTDLGTLVLSGTNSYTGGTLIEGGTLRISSDANLGDAAGGLSLDGGTLNTTSDVASARDVTLAGAGTLLTDSGKTLELSGAIAGPGALTKDGAGTVVLTGDAAHDGGTTIAAGTLQVGNGGTIGSLTGDVLSNGALIFNRSDDTSFAGAITGTGSLTQTGGGVLRLTGDSDYSGTTLIESSELRLENGGSINSGTTTLAGPGATLTVTGAGSSLTTTELEMGTSTTGGAVTLNIENGGQVTSTGTAQTDLGGITLPAAPAPVLMVNVAGTDSLWDVGGSVIVGANERASATVNVTNGGTVRSGTLALGPAFQSMTNPSDVTISGADSSWTAATSLTVFRGTLSLLDGGRLDAAIGRITAASSTQDGQGRVLISGAGSELDIAGALDIGGVGREAVVTVSDGGQLSAGGLLTLANLAGGSGTLNIGAAVGDTAAAAGTVQVADIAFGPGTGTINFNHTDTAYDFGAAMSGTGAIKQLSGVTLLSGDSTGFSGLTSVSGGALYVNNALGGNVGVATGGVLGGIGTIGGDVDVADGVINPGDLGVAPGTLTINGNLSLDDGSTLDYNFGQASVVGGPLNDLTKVGGNLTLDGTLNVSTSAGGSFDPGIYRVISYDGTLTDNGMAIGTIPSADFYLQTSVDHQVNLVNTAGMVFRFWDGDTGPKNNSVINGGNGTWQNSTGNDDWVQDGTIPNAPFADSAFAIFTGESGTVTVDKSLGAVGVSGMQFAVDGYDVKGDAITLVGTQSIIRVGDGAADGATFTTTIDSELAGVSQLVKTDLGTLVLTGDNTYIGGTAVNGGTLLVNGDQSTAKGLTSVDSATLGGTGIIGGDVEVAGGTIAPGSNGVGTLTVKGGLTLDAGSTLAMELGQADVEGGTFNDLIKVDGDLVLDGTVDVTVPTGGSFDPGVYRVFDYGGTLTDHGLDVGTLPAGSAAVVQTAVAGQVNLINVGGLFLNFWDGAAGPKFDHAVNGGDGIWQNSSGNNNWTDDAGALNAPYQDGGFAVFEGASGTVTVDNSQGQVTASGMQFVSSGYTVAGAAVELVGPQATIRVGDGTGAGSAFTATIASQISGASQLIKTDLGTLVLTGANSYTGGTAINGGTLEIATDGNLGAAAAGGISFDGGTLRTSADLVSGRSVVVSGDGTIATDKGTTFTLNGLLSGSGTLTKDGAGTLLVIADSSGYAGTSRVAAGTFAVDGVLGGQVDVAAGGRLEGNGQVGGVTNAGVVAPGRSIGTLTIAGDYAGNDGSLQIETTLGGDNSPSDLLVVNGDTSGSTGVDVINRGGLGGQTRNGIKVVDVAGASNGTFALKGDYVFNGDPAVVAGAYGYRLYKNGIADPSDGDWYLRSSLLDPAVPGQPGVPLYQPGVPLYESYAGSLQQFNQLGTLQQRVGNRMWAARADGAQGHVKASKANDSSGVWVRIEAAHAELEPAVTTSSANYDASTWKFQAGIDNLLMKNRDGRLIGGVFAQYGTISSGVWSPYGVGGIDTTAYGVGTTMTWYGESGVYADGQAQVTWYDSDLDSATAGRSLVTDNDGIGYGVSMEAGRRIPLTETWSLTPQAQLAGSWVRFDDFTDPFGADVSLDYSHSVIGRLGIASNHDVQWRDANRRVKRAHVYAIANVYYDFEGESQVEVAGTPFASRNDRLYGGVGLGGSLNWADDKYSLYGEARLNTSLENPGDSNIIGGTVGFRMRW